jgi:hypothetical protein
LARSIELHNHQADTVSLKKATGNLTIFTPEIH